MMFLLDTHVLLWWLMDDALLSKKVRDVIGDSRNRIFVSAASAWEISIKKSLKKLDAPNDLEDAIAQNGFEALPIAFAHARVVGALPRHHDDPFDRMLIAQAKVENLSIITHDMQMQKYHKLISLLAA